MPWPWSIRNDPLLLKWPTLVNVMLSRLVLLCVLLLTLTVLLPYTGDAFFVFIGFAFIITIPYAYWLHVEASPLKTASYQFALDVVIVSGLIHFTGGVRSDLVLLYPLIILIAGIVISGRMALQVALLSIFLYAAVVILEMEEVLVYRGPLPFPYENHLDVIRDLMMRVVIFSFFAAAASFVTDRCLFQDKQLRRLQSIGELIFDNVAAPLLGVRRDGTIVLVNTAASRLFHAAVAELRARNIFDFFIEKPGSLAEAASGAKAWRLRRADDSIFPCLIEVELAKVPAFTPDMLGFGETDFYLVVFNDLTRLMAQEQEQQAHRRLDMAAGMVAEMAHVVRNPLTAIKGAGELLAQTAGLAAHRRQDVTAGDWTVISSLCEVISEETIRLDRKVQDLMDYAATDPAKLLEVANEAGSWAEKAGMLGDGTHGQNTLGR